MHITIHLLPVCSEKTRGSVGDCRYLRRNNSAVIFFCHSYPACLRPYMYLSNLYTFPSGYLINNFSLFVSSIADLRYAPFMSRTIDTPRVFACSEINNLTVELRTVPDFMLSYDESFCLFPSITNRALYLSICPFGLRFTDKIIMEPITFAPFGRSSRFVSSGS